MCGIAAIVNPVFSEQATSVLHLGKMLNQQSRRGPDGQSSYNKRSVYLGHRLLRIIDCPQSSQPMSSGSESLTITFNGEIYNFRDLRKALQASGIQFHTKTDTEVLLQMYRKEGLAMLPKLRGMFAFILHDPIRKEILVARDALGQKPIYFTQIGSRWYFASSFLAISAVSQRREVDADSQKHYLWNLMPHGNHTLLRNIDMIEPSSFLRLSEDGRLIEMGKFEPDNNLSVPRNIEEAGCQFSELLDSAVAEQAYDQPAIATHLSGGLDSSAIAASLRKVSGLNAQTYSCSYNINESEKRVEERGFEELHFARLVACHLDMPNEAVRIAAEDYLFDLVDIVEALEEPRGNPCLPHFQLARVISKKHKIVLSGEGADELFGGYHWRIRHAFSETNPEAAFWNSLLPAPEALMKESLAASFSDPQTSRDYVFQKIDACSSSDRLDKILAFDRSHFLHYLLLQADRLSGYFGMEGRYPFLDSRIVHFASHLPGHLVYEENTAAKPVIRAALKDRLPTAVMERPKMGFVAPEGAWYGGELFGFVSALLLDPNSYVQTLFDRGALRGLLQLHRDRKYNLRKMIWSLLILEIWHRLIVQQQTTETLREQIQLLRFEGRNYDHAA